MSVLSLLADPLNSCLLTPPCCLPCWASTCLPPAPCPCPCRYSALEVLFDILKYHGSSFSPQFWLRVFDSVLLPIFDHVRAEVTDTTTFTDDKRRAEVDSWLYDTCTRTLQHIVDIVVQYYAAVSGGWVGGRAGWVGGAAAGRAGGSCGLWRSRGASLANGSSQGARVAG